MRPAYYQQVHRARPGMRAAVPGRRYPYLIRESSPYSLASMQGLEGWASFRNAVFNKPIKQVSRVVSKAAQQTSAQLDRNAVTKFVWKGVKNVGAFTANVYTLGLANKLTSVSQWSGARRAGKAGTVVGITAAAVAGGFMAAGALAPAATGATATGSMSAVSAELVAAQIGQAAIPATVGTYGATVAGITAGAAEGLTVGGVLSTGAGYLGTAAKVLPTLMIAKGLLTGGAAPAAAAAQDYGSGGGYNVNNFTQGGGGAGGGGGIPGPGELPTGAFAESNQWLLPLLLVGGIGILMIKGR